MHGFSSGSTFLVNAEVDSMGGVVDGGVGVGKKPSPRRAAIEKAQAELRLEYDVREERRRELEFLEKGGNPLDFMFAHAASLSVQSTSHTCQQPDQILTSEAKGSFALTGEDSVESSGRLGVTTVCEPNSADNFDGENECGRKLINSNRSRIVPSEHSSQLDGSQNVKESDDSPIFHSKKGQAYRRRNRTRSNRDVARSNSNDLASRGGLNSLAGRLSKNVASENQFDGMQDLHLSTTSRASEISEGKLNILISKDTQGELQKASVEADDIPATITTVKSDLVSGKDNVVSVDAEGVPCFSIEQKEDNTSAAQVGETGKINGDVMPTPNDTVISDTVILPKGLDSEPLHTDTSLSLDGNGNTESGSVTNLKNVDDNGLREKSINVDNEVLIEKLVNNPVESTACFKEDQSVSHQDNDFTDKDQEIDNDRLSTRDKVECPINVEEQGVQDHVETKTGENEVCDASVPKANSCPVRLSSSDPSFEVNKNDSCALPPTLKLQTSSESQKKLFDKAHEDRVLEEARIIEAKRRRIAELSVGSMPMENRQKSHWDFVLEEMAWLANDFMQERVWKMTAAAQICHRVAFASRLRMEEQRKCWKQKTAAQSLAKAVMEFWHSAGLCVGNDPCSHSSQPENCKLDASVGENEFGHGEVQPGDAEKDEASKDKQQSLGKKQDLAVFKYAVRFLQENCSSPSLVKSDGSGTPDVVCDGDITEVLWQDHLTEENLFYVVPPGAMETYRKSIESCLAEFERVSTSIPEEADISMYESTTENVYQENDYDEDEGENLYNQPGYRMHENGRPIKKKKSLKVYANRYGLGSDFGYGGVDSRNGTPTSALLGKRPANNLQVGLIPTKRTRTAPRQRVVSFTPGSAGVALTPSRDNSSGETNSFQDDQSTLHGPIFARGSEVDSPMDYDKQLTIDSADNSGKFKKKKKLKNQLQGASYTGWLVDPSLQNNQKDHVRKRYDHPIDSNGNSGFNVHIKKPKTKLENSFESIIPASGSVISPVASQMSNMSSQNKIIKILGGREKRKAKGIKVPAVQPGSESQWSSFEDQALIVLVHDMGPNWELISDAINSTLRFKCIFRKAHECKERHKNLMEGTPGDGADSAEDSGSSQPYPSTLPGIPKGSARQLFQQLQKPMEEDTIKSHFDKMIHIAKQLHYRKKQNDNQDMKQRAPVHGSHIAALSQVIPNNLNGAILTPLDLCDFSVSNQDAIPLGFQGPHAGGLSSSNQGSSQAMQSPGGFNSSVQGLPGSPSMGIGNNFPSQSSQFSNSRDARYPVPRPTSLSVEEQQRLQQYGHMLPGRNVQAPNLSSGSLSGADRGVRMLPGGSSAGMVGGMSRGMPIPRQGLQGTTSPMLNSGSMVSSNMGGVPSNMNIQTASGQGSSTFRAREALHTVQPGKSSDQQRQMTLPEASSSGAPPFNALSSGFTNQTASLPLQPYAASHHQQHPMPLPHSHVLGGPHNTHLPGTANHIVSPEQQQAYLRLVRDRQIQQRLLQRQHQQQQRPASSALMTHAQSSSSPQSVAQLQSPSSSQTVPVPPVTHSPTIRISSQSTQQHKHQAPSQGHGRNSQSGASGLVNNQAGKQRERQTAQQLQQSYQQSGRQHPQQRQQSQPAKPVKGIVKRDMVMHQNLPMDPSHLNGLTANSGNQVAEKGEQTVHLMQSHGMYPGSGLNVTQPSKSLPSSQTSGHLQQQKPYANSVSSTAKQIQQIPSHVDGNNLGPATAVSSSPTSTGMPNHKQLQGQSQPHLKVVNQSPSVHQKAIQQNRQLNSDPLTKLQPDNSQAEQQFVNNTNLNARVQQASPDITSSLPISSPASSAVPNQVEDCSINRVLTSTPTPSEPVSGLATTNSSGSETLPSVSEALGQRNLSGDLADHGRGQFKHQQLPLQNDSSMQPILPQKQSQHQLQKLEKSPQPQPQSQNHAGKSSVFARTPTSRLE